jgi:hypothetical protein
LRLRALHGIKSFFYSCLFVGDDKNDMIAGNNAGIKTVAVTYGYGKEVITERHRHRYEVNNNLIDKIENAGLKISGRSIDGSLESLCQYHHYGGNTQKVASYQVLRF